MAGNSIAEVFVTVLPETSRVAEGMKKAFRDVDNDAREAGQRWGREIERGVGDVKVNLKADTAEARAEIDRLDGKDVKVKVSVDRSELDRLTSGAGGAGGAGSAGGLLGGIGLQPLAIAAAIPVVSSLSGVLGLLPAAAGGAAGAIGTLMVAVHGFSDAMGDINDPKKFAEDLTQISPAAQQAAQAIQGLMPQVKTLMMTVQDAFFNGIGTQIQGLATTYLPMFQTFMGQMAGTMNRAMTGLSQLFQTPEMMGQISAIINNLSVAFEAWSKSINPIVSALTKVGVVGSQFLPQLGQAAAQAAQSFSQFITQISQSGQLGTWIQTGIQAMGVLANITQTVIKAFMDMAPAGLPILNVLATTLAQLEPMVGPLATQFGQWGTAMTPLVGIVAQLVTSLLPVFISAMQNLNQTISATVGPISTVVGWLGQLGGVMKSLSGSSNFAAGFFHSIATTAQEALNPLQQLYDIYKAIKQLTVGGSLDVDAHQKLNDAVAAARNGTSPGASSSPGVSVGGGFGGGSFPQPGALGSFLTSGPVDGWSGASLLPPAAPVSTYVAPPLPPSGGGAKTKTPPLNLPYTGTADPNAGTYPSGTVASGAVASNVYTGGQTSDTHGLLVPNAANLKTLIQQQFGISDIGGYRQPDGYNEHSSGQALDIMVGANKQLGDQVNQFLLKNASALGIQYDLWQQQQWNPDGSTSGMENRGSPTANHMDHVHVRVRPGSPTGGALSSPVASAYPGMTPAGGLTSQDLSLRNAQERVNDTQHSEEQAQARMDELNAKGTATAREREAAEYSLAKAKREHKDAIDALTVAQGKYNTASQKTAKGGVNNDAQSLGSSFLSGIGQIFGLDGSVFADPTQFGLFKIFKAAMGLKFDPSQAAPGMGQGGMPAGGGGDLFGGLLSSVPQAFGALQIGSPQTGPTPFMPAMPAAGGGGSLLDAVQGGMPGVGGPNSPGPGNYIDNSINVSGQFTPPALNQDLTARQAGQMRAGPMLDNLPK